MFVTCHRVCGHGPPDQCHQSPRNFPKKIWDISVHLHKEFTTASIMILRFSLYEMQQKLEKFRTSLRLQIRSAYFE